MKTRLGITMGDPAGVGPEILLHAAPLLARQKNVSFFIFGDCSYLLKVHRSLKRKKNKSRFIFYPLSWLDFCAQRFPADRAKIPVVDLGLLKTKPLTFGRETAWGGEASGIFIWQAVEAALKNQIQGIVTLPINKQSFARSHWGRKYVDHTGMLAALTKSKSVALMLAAGPLRAVHVTQHVPLAKVSKMITRGRVAETIRLTHEGLKRMGIQNPRIAVSGLNPHAGDGGVLGQEERMVIAPVVRRFRRRGWRVQGPLSADTVWPLVKSGKFDAGVAMYHDQGQIPVKMDGHKVVNVTLGLPFVRTSVGHGTAFEIAGRGQASPQSFLYAVETAVAMLKR